MASRGMFLIKNPLMSSEVETQTSLDFARDEREE